MSSSNSASAKVNRAISQVERAEILLRQLPRKVYLNRKKDVDEITRDLDRIADEIKHKLSFTIQ